MGNVNLENERVVAFLVLGSTTTSALSLEFRENIQSKVGDMRGLIDARYNIVRNLLRPVLPLLSKLLSQRLVFV